MAALTITGVSRPRRRRHPGKARRARARRRGRRRRRAADRRASSTSAGRVGGDRGAARRGVPGGAGRGRRAWSAAEAPGRVVFVVPTASRRAVQGDALARRQRAAFLTTIGQVGAVELGRHGVTVNVVVHGWLEGAAGRLRGRRSRSDGWRGRRTSRPRSPSWPPEVAAYVNGAVARRRRRLLDHEDRAAARRSCRLAAAMRLSLRRQHVPPRSQPWESALELARLLEHRRGRRLPDGQPLAPAARGHPRRHPGRSAEDRVRPRGARPRASPTSSASRGRTSSASRRTTRTRPSASVPDTLFGDLLELAVRIRGAGDDDAPGHRLARRDARRLVRPQRRGARPAGRAGGERGVRFSIEPHLGSIAQDPAEAARLCARGARARADARLQPLRLPGLSARRRSSRSPPSRGTSTSAGRGEKRMQAALKDSRSSTSSAWSTSCWPRATTSDLVLEYLWIDWEHLNECDTVSETILLRDRLRAKLAGEPWQYPASTI